MKLTDEQIETMQETLKNATPGPWGYQKGGYAKNHIVFEKATDNIICTFKTHENCEDNGHLIANAPEWIRWLLADRQEWKEGAELERAWRESLQKSLSESDGKRSNQFHQLSQAVEVLKKAESFIGGIISLYGQGLLVINWHQNGDPEPWDNLFDENMEGDELELIQEFLSSLSQEGNTEEISSGNNKIVWDSVCRFNQGGQL